MFDKCAGQAHKYGKHTQASMPVCLHKHTLTLAPSGSDEQARTLHHSDRQVHIHVEPFAAVGKHAV